MTEVRLHPLWLVQFQLTAAEALREGKEASDSAEVTLTFRLTPMVAPPDPLPPP